MNDSLISIQDRHPDEWAAWRYYASFYRRGGVVVAGSVLAALAHAALLLSIAVLSRRLFDQVLPDGNVGVLAAYTSGILGLYLLSGLIAWLNHMTILGVSKAAIRRLRDAMLDRYIRLPDAFLARTDRSLLHTWMVEETERVDMTSNAFIAQFLPAVVAGLVLCGLLVYLNVILFVVLALFLPLVYLLNRRLGRRLDDGIAAYRHSFERFSSGIHFVLHALDLIRASGAETLEAERQHGRFDDAHRSSERMARLHVTYSRSQQAVVAVAVTAALLAGGVAVINGSMSPGSLAAFLVGLALLRAQADTLASAWPHVRRGHASLSKVYEVMRDVPAPPYVGTRGIPVQRSIALENVTFGYDASRSVLRGIDLTLTPAEIVAITGPNGAGKTTLVKLILGYYRPSLGRLTADGVPYDEVDMAHLRRRLGLVPQSPVLLSASAFENIAFGKPETDIEDVLEAARLAGADAFIRRLPDGYDTPVGEGGALLSGGQRQLIALARALLGRPFLLILDEPTNHLDADAVKKVMSSLVALPHAPCILIISHDSAVTDYADRRFALVDGRLTASVDSTERPAAAYSIP